MTIGFDELYEIYTSAQLIKGRAAVYAIALFISIIITVIKLIKQAERNATDEGASIGKKLLVLIKPLLPFYIILGMLPFLITSLETVINTVFNNMDVQAVSFYDMDESLFELLNDTVEEYENTPAYNVFGTIALSVKIEFIWFIAQVSKYLFSFALGTYFLWLIGIEVFAPVAVLGIVFKEEFSWITHKWVSNLIACKMYLVLLLVSNVISIGFYKIFNASDDYWGFMTIIIFLLFRVYLYKQAMSIASKVF